ncbi:MAG: hypothetical protein KGL39_38065 [Patescibacteria group bacterium]|nr:hypothetical protein [Patescibacteria group bacterium]
MQFVQTLITDEQALKVRLAIDLVLQDPERFVMTDEERTEYERLAVFYGHAASNPAAFSPTGEMAQTVKKLVRSAKGPAQPSSRRNRRKRRQERRTSWRKRERMHRRETAEQFNAAMEALRRDAEEAEAAAQEAQTRYESEAKFDILGPDGQTVMLRGVPESAIRAMSLSGDGPKIILPGTAEALGLEGLPT